MWRAFVSAAEQSCGAVVCVELRSQWWRLLWADFAVPVCCTELPAICPYRKGRDVLDHFNIPSSRSDLWQCAWVLAMLAMGYRMLAFALLKWLSRRSRG